MNVGIKLVERGNRTIARSALNREGSAGRLGTYLLGAAWAMTLVGLGVPLSAHAWSHHALLTHHAIQAFGPLERKRFEERTPVETLQNFLQAEAAPVGDYFLRFAQTVGARRPKRFRYLPFDPGFPSVAGFLRAARLKPHATFPLLERAIGERSRGKTLLKSEQIRAITGDAALSSLPFYALAAGDPQSARSILSTFVDEPDWGFDQALWGHVEYGYGESPYGDLTGTSSQAPFHMLFLRENWIVRHFVSFLTEGMMEDRVELFRGLSQLAFERGHAYWGWRFLAWSLHYLQDLTQPYHAKAVPHVGLSYYLKFAVSSKATQDRVKTETSQRVKNRHFALEDFASFVLLYPNKISGVEVLTHALERGEGVTPFTRQELATVSLLLDRIADASDQGARALDDAVSSAFGPRVSDDPQYDLERDSHYSIEKTVLSMPPGPRQSLVQRVKERFGWVGVLTRQWVGEASPRSQKLREAPSL